MTPDAIAHLEGEIQASAIVFQHVDDTEALLVMAEAAGDERVEDALSGVAERCVAEIVTKGDGFGQFLVEAKTFAMVRAICETSSVCVRRVR
jgi:hypothetical protein